MRQMSVKLNEQNENGKNDFHFIEYSLIILIMIVLIVILIPDGSRYIEKRKIAEDILLAESVRDAVLRAMTDPRIATDKDLSYEKFVVSHITETSISYQCTGKFLKSMKLSLGIPLNNQDIDEYLVNQLKSTHNKSEVKFKVAVLPESNYATVEITSTDATGGKDINSITPIKVQ